MLTKTESQRPNLDTTAGLRLRPQTPLAQSSGLASPPGASPLIARSPIKWGSATRVLGQRPLCWEQLQPNVMPMEQDPAAHDVMIARVKELGRHTRIELDSGRKAAFFVGDLLAVTFGRRYATGQFFGDIPGLQEEYHMLSQGGVCGRVLSAPNRFSAPTLLAPVGYLSDSAGRVVNLRDHGMVAIPGVSRAAIVVVVGSSMDSGKTTMAANLIHGLSVAGCRVNAAKLTGTACVKDLNKMADAGASATRDFTHVGFASTSQASVAELHELCDVLISNLTADAPDYLVLEIADGIVQRETQLLLDYLSQRGLIDHLCLAVHDVLAAPTCLDILHRKWGLKATAVSGAATASPLSTGELRSLAPATPCLTSEDLSQASVLELFRSGAQSNE